MYEKYGEIQEIILPCQSNPSLIGYAFIEFKRMQDASKAIFNTNKKEFFGNRLYFLVLLSLYILVYMK